MRTVYLYEEIFTRKEFAIEVPDEVSDAQAEIGRASCRERV